MAEAKPEDVAAWMLDSIEPQGRLYQADAVRAIKVGFGEMFVYRNDAGNDASDRAVLSAFCKLSRNNVVCD